MFELFLTQVQKINNLENDNAVIHTEKRHSQLKECFVLLSDFNKNKKIIHKTNKGQCLMFKHKIINHIIIFKKFSFFQKKDNDWFRKQQRIFTNVSIKITNLKSFKNFF